MILQLRFITFTDNYVNSPGNFHITGAVVVQVGIDKNKAGRFDS